VRGDRHFPVRLRYAKRGKVRWIGHRDVARAFERAFRTERLPLAFSEGFSPHPKVSFGLALSVGHESVAEYLDLQLTEPVDLDELPSRLSAALPAGIDVTGAAAIADRSPSLQESVTAVGWVVTVGSGDGGRVTPDALASVVADALARSALPTARVRKGREVVEDVRPAVRAATVLGVDDLDAEAARLALECATRPVSPKPAEVLAALAAAPARPQALVARRVLRTHQWIERDGARREPLDADPRPHVLEARAS
jgi:radical SAM-linked protein